MPLEVRELIIKVTIEDTTGKEKPSHSLSLNEVQNLKKTIIEECIEKLNEKLSYAKER